MDFFLFILLNASLFIRPGELSPALAEVPLFQLMLALCLAASGPRLFNQWSNRPLVERPVTLCAAGYMGAIVASQLAQFEVGMALGYGRDFLKAFLYLILLVGIIDTPGRLRAFLAWMVLIIATMATLVLLHHHGYIVIPSIPRVEREELDGATGEAVKLVQLVGTGIVSDPNDLCLILALAVLYGLYLVSDRGGGLARVLWIAPVAVCGYAVYMTQSRGGLLALLAGIGTLLVCRLGVRKSLALAAVGVPVLLAVLGGRFAKMSAKEDTAQERITLWWEALHLFRRSPLFGVGANTLDARLGLVAHNSYVHSLAETGLVGGFFFMGMFYAAFRLVYGAAGGGPEATGVLRARPFVLAGLTSFAVGLYALSRNYIPTTYLAAGLAEVYQRLAPGEGPRAWHRLGPRGVKEVVTVEVCFIVFIHAFIYLTR